MDVASWVMLAAAVFLVVAGIVWWRRNARDDAPRKEARVPVKPRDRRRGPRRINTSRRESFRMGKDDNDRRKGGDRRDRKPGWDDEDPTRTR